VTALALEQFLSTDHLDPGTSTASATYDCKARSFAQLQTNIGGSSNVKQSYKLPRQPRWRPTPAGAEQRRPELEAKIQAWLTAAIKPLKMKQLGKANLLISVEEDGDDADSKRYFAGCCGNAVAGVVPFRALFVECRIVERFLDGTSRLEQQRKPHMITRPLGFGGAVSRGMLDHFTHWDIAAFVLEGRRATQVPLRLTFKKLRHRPRLLDEHILLGDDASCEPLVVLFDSADPAGAAGPEPPVDGAHSEVDWDSGVLPSRRSQQLRRREVPRPSQAN